MDARRRLLTVDDNAVYLEVLAENLVQAGYDVRTAASGEEALTTLTAEPVDCVLLDLYMPGLSGEEVCARIKQNVAWRDIPLVMLTASEDRDVMIACMNAGADDFVSKAVDISVLKARIRAQIRRKDIEDENRLIRERSIHARSEARFQGLIRSSIIGVIVAEASGRVLDANDAFLELLGFSRTELDARPLDLLALVSPDERALVAAAIAGVGAAGSARIEAELVRPDGRRVAVLIGLGLPVASEPMVGFVLDRTEQRRAKEALLETNRALERARAEAEQTSKFKSMFLANMSHELRTPLNAIIGFSELLLDGHVRSDAPAHDELLGDILASGRHLHGLVNELLDLSKVEAGKLSFVPEEVDARAVVDEVTSVLRGLADAKSVRIEAELDPDVRSLLLDPSRLKQVIYNYVSNAVKVSPAGGRVVLRVRAAGPERFRIEVEDAGKGIPASAIGRLFQEFEQLDATSPRQEGTGLGLALAKKLVEAQGGSVGVESTVGVGSTFFAELPRRAPG